MYAPSQWETTLHCNVVSHWLSAYTNDPGCFTRGKELPWKLTWRELKHTPCSLWSSDKLFFQIYICIPVTVIQHCLRWWLCDEQVNFAWTNNDLLSNIWFNWKVGNRYHLFRWETKLYVQPNYFGHTRQSLFGYIFFQETNVFFQTLDTLLFPLNMPLVWRVR